MKNDVGSIFRKNQVAMVTTWTTVRHDGENRKKFKPNRKLTATLVCPCIEYILHHRLIQLSSFFETSLFYLILTKNDSFVKCRLRRRINSPNCFVISERKTSFLYINESGEKRLSLSRREKYLELFLKVFKNQSEEI